MAISVTHATAVTGTNDAAKQVSKDVWNAGHTVSGAAASGANSDITSLTGLTTPLSVAQGGTASAYFTPIGLTAARNITFPDAAMSVGYLSVPANSQSAAYTCVLGDSGYSIDHPSTDANARTFTIPANSSVAYPVGTCISFSNMTSQAVTIAITTDTMYLSSAGTTGSRTLAQYGVAVARKLTSTTWLISGSGLT